MPDRTTTSGLAARAAPYALTIVGAAAVHKASFLIWDATAPLLTRFQEVVYQSAMALGLSPNVAELCATYTLYIILVVFYLICGAIIGATCRGRWLRFMVLFGITLGAWPYVMTPRDLQAMGHFYGWKALGYGTLLNLSIFVISGMPAAWIASRPNKRRRERRRAAQLCEACGYSLAGNTSGVCPECGMSTSQEIKKPAMANFIRRLKWPDPDAGQ